MSAAANGRVAQTLAVYLRAAEAGLDLHFGEGFSANNPAQAVTAAFLIAEIERAGAIREGLQTVCEAIGELQEEVSAVAVAINALPS